MYYNIGFSNAATYIERTGYGKMNNIGIIRHPIFKKHINSVLHPETPERLAAIDRAIASHELGDLIIDIQPRLAEIEEIGRVHATSYIQLVSETENQKHTDFDWDTGANQYSFEAARYAAGAAIVAVDTALKDPAKPVYALVRPPGHHAEKSKAMGFCLFNNLAIAAEHAIATYGIRRILIFDWDVHHGNGTMHSFYDRSDIAYVSIHQFPHYPGTGSEDEIGEAEGKGYTINIPLPPGSTDTEYRFVVDEILIPFIREYRPELALISAGFDAHTNDPLSSMYVSSSMFSDMALLVKQEITKTTAGALVLALEGGYNLPALEESNALLIRALCGAADVREISPEPVDQSAVSVADTLKGLLSPYWRCFAR